MVSFWHGGCGRCHRQAHGSARTRVHARQPFVKLNHTAGSPTCTIRVATMDLALIRPGMPRYWMPLSPKISAPAWQGGERRGRWGGAQAGAADATWSGIESHCTAPQHEETSLNICNSFSGCSTVLTAHLEPGQVVGAVQQLGHHAAQSTKHGLRARGNVHSSRGCRMQKSLQHELHSPADWLAMHLHGHHAIMVQPEQTPAERQMSAGHA